MLNYMFIFHRRKLIKLTYEDKSSIDMLLRNKEVNPEEITKMLK